MSLSADAARTLLNYNYAAHAAVWRVVLTLTTDQYSGDTGYSFGSIEKQLQHLLYVDRRWFARIAGQPLPAAITSAEAPDAAALKTLWDASVKDILAQAERFTDSELARVFDYDMPHRGGMKRNAAWQIVTHVVNHGTDHRAQILAMLHMVGAPTLEQDIMFYYWNDHHFDAP